MNMNFNLNISDKRRISAIGTYPIGTIDTWHGGIHVDLESINALADGEIIAYKISSEYCVEERDVQKENGTIERQTQYYSDSFVLMKHNYQYGEGKEFVFYTLYNHLQSKNSYIRSPKKSVLLNKFRKAYIPRTTKNLKIGGIGLNIRKASSDISDIIGIIDNYSIITIEDKGGDWAKITSCIAWKYEINSRRYIREEIKEGYCIFSGLRSIKEDGSLLTDKVRKMQVDTAEDYYRIQGLILRNNKGDKSNFIGIIDGKDTNIEILEQDGYWFKVKVKMLWIEHKYADKVEYIGTNDDFEGWVEDVDKKWDAYEEPEYDKVITCSKKVTTNDIIGYAGKYEGFSVLDRNHHAIHIELFTNDNIDEFFYNMQQLVTEDNKVFERIEKNDYFRTTSFETIKNYEYKLDLKNKSGCKNLLSPYDWKAFGFKIFSGDNQTYILNKKSNLYKEILSILDTNLDGKISDIEFNSVRNLPAVREHLSKMVCVHRSEWAYRGTSLAALKAEISVHYDEIIKIINPKTQEKKTKLLKNKEEAIARFEKKAKQLSFFWDIPSLSWHLDPAKCDYTFTYFHPIAFIEQMKRIAETKCNVIFSKDDYDKVKYGNLLREINIRLAGFGGNVPTDDFDDRTEVTIKQFQRDYMQHDETGHVCMCL
ncbi:MAG: hypothetical protein ACRC77_11910, partial [Bacteroidales bacterium]